MRRSLFAFFVLGLCVLISLAIISGCSSNPTSGGGTPIPAPTHSQTFTSSGIFTVEAGVTSITVEVWGAGGGGEGSSSDWPGGGGGGGGYGKQTFTVASGDTYPVTVGGGGAGGRGGNAGCIGLPGGSSSFHNLISAGGGTGGSGTGFGGAGGDSTATINVSGGAGKTVVSNFGSGGNGGTGGNGGRCGNGGAPSVDGSNGTAPGGGGGGGGYGTSSYTVGGDGASGEVIVTW